MAQLGRALRSGRKGRRFESCHPDQNRTPILMQRILKLASDSFFKTGFSKAGSIMKRTINGFTLIEMLIVIAILAVLIPITIPVFASQLEKVREAADLANVRSAYAQVSVEALVENPKTTVTVNLKQKKADWQSMDPVNIGGIVHYKNQGDTDNWKGVPMPNGTCVVSYNKNDGIILTWNGKAGPSVPKYPFNINETNLF